MSAHKDFEVDTRPGIDDLTVTVELDDGTEMECMALYSSTIVITISNRTN